MKVKQKSILKAIEAIIAITPASGWYLIPKCTRIYAIHVITAIKENIAQNWLHNNLFDGNKTGNKIEIPAKKAVYNR